MLDEIRVRAHLSQRVIDDISSSPHDGRLAQLLGSRVGPGFRSSVGKLLPEEAQRASLLNLLLDDWVGAALVSGYAVQHAAIVLGVEEKLPAGTADNMAGICAGFAPEASLVAYARRNGTIPSVHGPVAPPLDIEGDGLHAMEPLRAHGMRRFRRLDLRPVDAASADYSVGFDAHFRDSHVDGDGVETIVHEYTVAGSVDTSTRTITTVTRGRAGAAVAGVPRCHRKCDAGARNDAVGDAESHPWGVRRHQHVHASQRHAACDRRPRCPAGSACRPLGLDNVRRVGPSLRRSLAVVAPRSVALFNGGPNPL